MKPQHPPDGDTNKARTELRGIFANAVLTSEMETPIVILLQRRTLRRRTLKPLLSTLGLFLLVSTTFAQAPAPKYAAPAFGIKKAVITKNVGPPTLAWIGDTLAVTTAGGYNYMTITPSTGSRSK